MDHTAILLVAFGAVFAAIYNVLTKRTQTGDWTNRSSLLVALHLGGAAIVMFVVSAFTGGPEIQPGFLFAMATTGVLNIGIMLGKMRARALEDVSLVTPIDSTTPAIVIVTSMILLGEYPTRLGWIGIWLMVIGTYSLNIAEVQAKLAAKTGAASLWQVYLAPFAALGRSAGVRWAFLAVALSTISLNYDGLVARRANIGFGFGCVFLIAAAGNMGVALWRREYRGVIPSEAFGKTWPLAIAFAATNYITNFAFRHSIVPYVGTMKRLQIPLTIILAYFILGEKKSFRERFVGGLLMAVGAGLIALGG